MEILLFDIDGTLFDSYKFKSLILKYLSRGLGLKEEIIRQGLSEYYRTLETSTDFYPDDFLNYFYEKYKTLKYLDGFMWKNKDIYKDCLFPDVIPALKKLSDNKILGIYSQGFKDFQINKLKKTGIIKYFNKKYIFIERRKLSDKVLLKIPKNSIIVEDKIEIVERLNKTYNPIWLNRKSKRQYKNMKIFFSLTDLSNSI